MRLVKGAESKLANRAGLNRLKRVGVSLPATGRVYCLGIPVVSMHVGSEIRIGRECVLTSRSELTALGVNHPVILRTLTSSARIQIGEQTGISGGTICSAVSVTIGKRCLIGANVSIFDTNFHPIDAVPRRFLPIPEGASTDRIEIGDDVFIGTGSVILPGATIGEGSVIGASSVVVGTIEPFTVAAGNPAQVIRKLRTELD